MDTRTTAIQGTWAYSAKDLVNQARLLVGTQLSLRREPNNKHDRNAVAVFAGSSKVGYLPRQLAEELARYFDGGGNHSAKVTYLGRQSHRGNEYPTVSIAIELPGLNATSGLRELEQAARRVLGKRGVYEILNRIEQRAYIGSAVDIGQRLAQHIAQLHNGTHPNQGLLDAWRRHGAASFEFRIIEETSSNRLSEREAFHIEQRGTYQNGYNRTKDGVGVRPSPSSTKPAHRTPTVYSRPEPIPSQAPKAFAWDPNAVRPPGKASKKGGGCLVLLIVPVAACALLVTRT